MNRSNRICRLLGLSLILTTAPLVAQDETVPEPLPGQEPVPALRSDPATTAELPPNWLETQIAILEHIEAGEFEAAEALREHFLEISATEFGPDSAQVAEAHLLLARIRRARQEYIAAEADIIAAIDIYTTEEGPISPTLIDPYLELGDTYDEAGDYAAAISAYSEARTIGRRHYGLLNQDQLVIIDQMASAAENLGQFEEARDLQLEALTLIERTSEEFSIESIDARYKYATWLRQHQRYDEERRFYFLIQRIISRYHDDDPVMYARLARARAASFRQENNADATGISGLREAYALLLEVPDPPALLMAELLVDIGDWLIEFERSGTANEEYVEAWNLLGRLDNADELRREWFEELIVLQIGAISMRGLSNEPDAPIGFVEIRFTVDESGRARDIEVTDSHPQGLKDDAIVRLYREARFRPRVENGAIVPVRRARRNEFRYLALD